MDFWIRADLPAYKKWDGLRQECAAGYRHRTFREQHLSSLEESQFVFRIRDGIELAICFEVVRWVVRIEDRPEKCRDVGFLPDFGCRFMSEFTVDCLFT